jgi:acetyl esterase
MLKKLTIGISLGMTAAIGAAFAQPEPLIPNGSSPAGLHSSKKTDAADAVVFKTVSNQPLRLFVDKPAGWKASDHRPAFVFFHGGGWVGGGALNSRAQTQYFAGRGLVGISVEYRLLGAKTQEPPSTCCADAKSAMRYIRSHATELGIDPDRIAAAGGSAGGHLAAFVALVPGQDDPHDDLSVSPRPEALVLFNPVLDNGPKQEGGWGNDRVRDRVKEFSPAHNVSHGAPPTILFLGTKDQLVPVETLQRFQARMKEAGTRCELFLYPDQAHAFFNRPPYTLRTLTEADKFLVSLGWLKPPAI